MPRRLRRRGIAGFVALLFQQKGFRNLETVALAILINAHFANFNKFAPILKLVLCLTGDINAYT